MQIIDTTGEQNTPRPWKVYRNGLLAARASYHTEAKSIISQLAKLHPDSEWSIRYEGRNISHCGERGQPL